MRREDLAYLPLAIVLALPVLACVLIMLIEPGINRSLFVAAIKTGVILVVVGGALCFVASRLAARSDS
jgi:protein-S-isoprenylcysteine O-methyltransferase Ste14